MPSKFGNRVNKFSKLPDETPVVQQKEERIGAWTKQEMDSGRPSDYVGGYDPLYIYNYRRRMERKKQIDLYK